MASTANAQYAYVPVTGFNADIVADGLNSQASVSTTHDVDNVGYVLTSTTFGTGSSACGSAVSNGLPANNQVTSTNTTNNTGITYTLQPYGNGATTNNNALRVVEGTSGTLTLTTPVAASTLYLVGLGDNTYNVTINFTDATSETVPGIPVPNWCGGAATYKLTGTILNRVRRTSGSCANCPYLYEIPVAISPSNYSKLIGSITINNLTGIPYSIFAVGMQSPCSAPPVATALTFATTTTSSISGSFTGGTATGHIVVRYSSGGTATPPSNGTAYTAGMSLGTGTVVSAGNTSNFTSTGLSGNTAYDFYVYSYNSESNCGGPVYSTALTGSHSTLSCGAPTLGTVTAGVRTITVGPTADAATITAVIANINTNGLNTPTIIELQSDYLSTSETFPILFPVSACVGSINTLTLRPAAGANGLTIAGSNAGPTVDLNGASYITIDGRPGGTGSTMPFTAAGNLNTTNLNITNTNAAGSAIKLGNGASNNTIQYCDIQGQNTISAENSPTIGGVIYMDNTGTEGNDNNTISYCNIHSTSTSASPAMGIYSLGTNVTTGYAASSNDNNTIDNCNIYDYFSATSGTNAAGIELNYGNNAWVVTNNSFFQTASRAVTSAYNRAIWIIPYRASGNVGNGFNISNNYIGGSQPQCAGTPYTLTNSGYFGGIRIEIADGTTPAATTIQNNTIRNISITSSTNSDLFQGIYTGGGTGIVNISDNTIGTVNGTGGATTGGITISSSASSVAGHSIMLTASGSSAIQNNVIANILVPTAGNYFSGIFANSNIVTTITNNTIGSLTEPKSIYFSDGSTSTLTNRYIQGMRLSPTGTLTITNNIVAGIWSDNVYTGSSGQLVGISISSTTVNLSGGITGNQIKNLYSAARSTGTRANSAIIGMLASVTSANVNNVSGNTINSLVSGGTSGAVNIIGLYATGATSVNNIFSSNNIHSIVGDPANASAVITGIYVAGGTSTYSNNIIRLGVNPDGSSYTATASIYGINSATTAANNFYNNTIYIGGADVGAAATNTFAFRRTGTSGTYNVKNNIFVNNRSNATTGGAHYAVYFATSNTGATLNNNLYYTPGTGGLFAYNGTANIASYAPGWIASDVSSVTGNPQFIAPDGNASSVNLHLNTSVASLAESHAVGIAGITDDFDGDSRSGYSGSASGSAPDIGADEFAGIYIDLNCSGTPAPGNTMASVSNFCVSGSTDLNVANNYVLAIGISYQWQSSPDGTIWTNVNGANDYSLTTGTLTQTTHFRLRVICNSGPDTAYSNPATITINPLPTVVVNPASDVFCTSAALTASGASTYTWSPAANLDATTGSTVNASPASSATYTVTGTDANGCVNTATATVMPMASFTPIANAENICAANTPASIHIIPVVASTGSIEYKLTDMSGNVLVDWQAGANISYTPTTEGQKTYFVFARNTICNTIISDTGKVDFFVGFDADVILSNAGCANGDGSITISSVQGPGSGNASYVWYSNDFSNAVLDTTKAALRGVANISGSRLELTANSNSKKGGLLVKNPTAISGHLDSVSFVLTVPQNGADGISWSFGDDVAFENNTAGNYEAGTGNKLILAFDSYGSSNDATGSPGIYLTYGQNNSGGISKVVSPTMLAYSNNTSWRAASNKQVSVYISSDNKLTLKIAGTTIFNNVQLPAAYTTAGKSGWQHLFAARTGGASAQHVIDNLNIYYNSDAYVYGAAPANSGTVPATWQPSPVFDSLTAGDSLDIWVANPLSPSTCNKLLGTYGVEGPIVTANLGSGNPGCIGAQDGYLLLKVPASGTYSVSYNKDGGATVTQTGLTDISTGMGLAVTPSLTTGTYTNFKVINSSNCVSNIIAGPVTLTAPMPGTIAPSTTSGAMTQTGAGTQYYTDVSCNLIAAVTSPANLGQVTSAVTVGGVVSAPSGEPFVGRYYGITPTQNSGMATTLKLYFNPSDFSDYNASPLVTASSYPAIAADGSNLRIKAYHGLPASGTTGPEGMYDEAAADLLQPTSVVLNSSGFWEVTVYSPNGFSGFFANTNTSTPLAIKLGEISARNEGDVNVIKWVTKTEDAKDNFILEHSNDGRVFKYLTDMAANGQPGAYKYIDSKPFNGINYYRLILSDENGRKEYSSVVNATYKNGATFKFNVFPNPVLNQVNVSVTQMSGKGTIEISDITGRILLSKTVTSTTTNVSMDGFVDGIYLVKYRDDAHAGTIKISKK